MRIRTIKPEFWTSEDIAAIPDWDTRLVFIGLWSYVDDNGVGRDNEKLIQASLFPLEEDPRETLARVSRALATLSALGRIVRYTVDGRDYLAITNWEKHQRIDRPGKARYPAPTRDDAIIRDTLARPSRESRDTPSTGTEEQRNRGTGDSAKAGALELAPPADPEPPPPAAPNPGNKTPAQTLTSEWIDHCTTRPPSQVIGQVSRHLKQLLEVDCIEYKQVRAGLIRWQAKGLHPSTLPSVVNEVINSQPAGVNGDRKQATTADLFDRMLARAAERDAQQKALEA